jgi:class 3 adenylate cyclase
LPPKEHPLTRTNPEAIDPTGHRATAFADLAGYIALTEAHGDDGAADVAIRFFEITSTRLKADARIVKTIGDTFAQDPARYSDQQRASDA